MPDSELVLIAREGAVATLTLNRPDKRNALNLALVRRLQEVLETLAADATLRAVVITGAGDKAFVAGADIAEI